MNALVVLYGGSLNKAALEKTFAGKSAVDMALERAALFPETRKIILLLTEQPAADKTPALSRTGADIIVKNWTKRQVLETLAEVSAGFDLVYYAPLDCPLLDPPLASALAERHLRYAADYTFADGYPFGLAPEILSPSAANRLPKIAFDDGPAERDILFSVIQKDINSFDIETEIAPIDLRSRRLFLQADSKRNLLLLANLMDAGFSKAADIDVIVKKPEILRTLPAYYNIQVSAPCPQACAICPYAAYGNKRADGGQDSRFMQADAFAALLDKIAAFSGDAVIGMSLWGELSLHPQKLELINTALEKKCLSLVIETSGIGWSRSELEAVAASARAAAQGRETTMPAVSWIVSLDAQSPQRYKEVRGAGMSEALETARLLQRLFPKAAYVQAVRTRGAEDDIEQFYRSWKAEGVNIIIQKYDNFCGKLPDLRVSDLSPIERQPCWHLMRDVNILIDGRVQVCREDIAVFSTALDGTLGRAAGGTGDNAGLPDVGNAFSESLETIWQRGDALYREHCGRNYPGMCADCDEYYVYNF